MKSVKKLRIGICDDSSMEREEIEKKVREIMENTDTEYELNNYESGESLLYGLEKGAKYDIFLLDVMMDGMDGMELAAALRARRDRSAIIFISSNREMAMCGYEVEAARYLSKPVKMERLREALFYCIKNIENKREIFLPTSKGECRVSLSEVQFIEVCGRGTRVVLLQGEIECRMNITTLESRLPSVFVRCHQGFLVNMSLVRFVRRNELEMKSGMTLPISKYRYQEVMSQFVRCLAE